MAVLDTNWEDIYQTTQYQNDLSRLLDLFTYSLGQEQYLNQTNPFIWAAADLAAVMRYFINNIPALKDIDQTPYIELIRQEVGDQLPATAEIPLVEWIRENKSWNGHKSPVPIFTYIGDLVGSPIQIFLPRSLIFTLDSPKSCIGGATSTTGPLPYKKSALANIEGGLFWNVWSYVVQVLETQQITSIQDLMILLNAVHPAGLIRIIEFFDNFEAPNVITTTVKGVNDIIIDCFTVIPTERPTLDNNWILDKPSVLIGGSATYSFDIFTNAIIPSQLPSQRSGATLDNDWTLDDLGSTLDDSHA